ncbi:MAG: DUF2849 domain-containing protein [Pseudomonadota bacterium]
MTHKIVTANRLTDGLAVWLSETLWVERIEEAHPLSTPQEVAAAEAEAARAVAARRVVDVATIDVTLEDGVPVPVRLRERIRAAGPTVRRDLGIQASLLETIANH